MNRCRYLAYLILLGTAMGVPSHAGAQAITEFPIPTAGGGAWGITVGADGNLWFTEEGSGKLGRITTAGVITEFPIPTANSDPRGITAGWDGNLWFTENLGNKIGRMVPGPDVITEFPTLSSNNGPAFITAGADGNLWFTNSNGNKIGKINSAGNITEFAIPTANSFAQGITSGADGYLWFAESGTNRIGRLDGLGNFTEFPLAAGRRAYEITAGPDGALWFTGGNKIGRITTAGAITEFPLLTDAAARAITAGPDGNLWFADVDKNKIGRITTSGVITEFPIPTANSFPTGIVSGPDGALWFTEPGPNKIGRLVPPPSASPLFAAVLPSSRSVQTGSTATAFASILNSSGTTATGCGPALVGGAPATFSFQTTNPATNALTGTPNTRVAIPPGGVQTFLMAFLAYGPTVSNEARIGYSCSGVDATATIVGVNTLLLTFDANPVPDMIAVGLTPSNDGYSRIPGVSGTGIFVIASTNIGVPKQLTARARFLNASTPATTLICETFQSGPQLGQCKSTPSPTVTRTINQNENTTWTAFITSTSAIPQDAAKHRVIFQFEDGPAIRGSTSTALTTQ
jgi:virginiamycin B lyase